VAVAGSKSEEILRRIKRGQRGIWIGAPSTRRRRLGEYRTMWKSWLDSGLNIKRAVAFRAVDILPEGGLFLVASFFGDLDLFGYCRGVV
jgi:hypothetical protein